MSGNDRTRFINGNSIKKVCFLVIVIYLFIYFFCIDVDYHNRGGYLMSVSASTIKFVNQWLAEGAFKSHFTCYECFDSIEFRSLGERIPYISYPTGSTFIVWFLAKLAGREHIGISFLKHIQGVFFLIETLVIGLFTYLFLSDAELKR